MKFIISWKGSRDFFYYLQSSRVRRLVIIENSYVRSMFIKPIISKLYSDKSAY